MAQVAQAQPRIIAHRGNSSVAPENTLAAFRAAVEAGADGVEFDVQASRDGVPVVIHDERLERTTNGKGWVADATAAELALLDAGAWFKPPFSGEAVPTLAQVLALLAPTRMELHVELKTSRVPYPGLVGAVLADLRTAGLLTEAALGAGRVAISSFNHRTLLEVRAQAPALPCAALTYAQLIDPWTYAAGHGFQGLHPAHYTVDGDLMRGARSAGLAVRPYTVDEPEEARRLMALGVDGIITNQPAALLRLRRGEAP